MSLTVLFLLPLIAMCYCHDCPQAWKPFGDSCYAFINEPFPWAVAQSVCASFSGYLAEIQSEAENHFVSGLLQERDIVEAWIGISDIVEEGVWVLPSLQRPLNYSNWAPGEPNDIQGRESCGQMYFNGQWNDHWCTLVIERPFVCERLTVRRS